MNASKSILSVIFRKSGAHRAKFRSKLRVGSRLKRIGRRRDPQPRERAGEAGGSGPTTAVPSPALPRGPGLSCPRPPPHLAHPTGSRVDGGGPRFERSTLRPSPRVGGPARPRVCQRPQRRAGLWRGRSRIYRRSDRFSLAPDLSGGRRAAGVSPPRAPPQPQFEFAA